MSYNNKMFSRTFHFNKCEPIQLLLASGKYEFDVYGASGGSNDNAYGGYGGYARGILYLRGKTKVFLHIGSQGSDINYGNESQGCNGGGYSVSSGRSGGGASDIRLVNDSLYSRVIVAGGGGGSGSNNNGGFGGGETGGNGEGS